MKKQRNKRKFKQQMHFLSLKTHLNNIRGLHANLKAVHHHLEFAKPHMLFLTETQIKTPADTAYLDYPGYTLEHRFKPRAGVCVYVRDDICCKRLRNLEKPKFSTLWILIDTGTDQTVYACVYRSHSGNQVTSALIQHLRESANSVQLRYPQANLTVLGDFTAHHRDWLFPFAETDFAGRETLEFALSHNLTQLVHAPTRVPDVSGHTANCLDLFLTDDPDKFSVSVSAPLGGSDHCLIKAVSVYSPPDLSPRSRRLWRFKKADWDEMRHFFASFPWIEVCFSSDNISSCADAIADVVRQGMEYFIPYNDVTTLGKARPWFGFDCAKAQMFKEEKFKAWANARKAKSPDLKEAKIAYNKATKAYKKSLHQASLNRIGRIGTKLASQPAGSKAFWSLAKSVESNFCRSSLPPLLRPDGTLAHSSEDKANLFVNLFADNSRLDPGNSTPTPLPVCSSVMPEVRIRHTEVLRVLKNLDINKASGPDGVPAIVLKTCAPELTPVLTRLFRLSLKTASVPKSWKLANVQPVPKKGSRSDPSNYRPIAITSIFCKILERVLNCKLLDYLERNDLFSDRQYGFRQKRSTGDLLALVTHIWGETIERHGEALAVSLDVSKAFDKVWHAGLLCKLTSYGITDNLCKWIADFLRDRSIRVVIDGCSSDLMTVNAGVPQGSVLSATLFLLHINDLLIPGIVGYADDSSVLDRYIPVPRANRAGIQSERVEMIERVNAALTVVSKWGDSNLVRFNAQKTQACVFSTKKEPFDMNPVFQSISIPLCNHLEILGMHISSNLNFGFSIEAKAKTAAKKLGVLNKVRQFFSPKQLLCLYQAQVRSCMEYCSHLWDGSAKYQLAALDSVEKRAIRLINDEALVGSRLHSLEHRRKVASLSVFYRLHFGECAQELHDLIPPAPFRHRSSKRSELLHPYIVDVPQCRTSRFGNSFIVRTARLWNTLPAAVFPKKYNLGMFKRRVNKYLLGKRIPP